jgi:hypothetical protein
MEVNKDALRNEIIEVMKCQGFLINPHLRPVTMEKKAIREIHQHKKTELLKSHKRFLIGNIEKVRKYSISGDTLEPEKIDLKLIEVKPESFDADLFLWWNLSWWSLPYERPIGRQIRFMLWDKYHNAPFGLIGLQSPPIRSPTRDRFLELSNKSLDYSYWINQSMYAQRLGALPPYNELLGAKMVCLSLTSNEIRECYGGKYDNTISLMEKRVLPSRLLFTTTTSAYGKSSVYARLTFNGAIVSHFIGFTAGSGTFHVPETLYKKILLFLKSEGIDVKRGYGTGPSRKLELITRAFRKLGIGMFTVHNIKRGYYIFENVSNLHKVIHENEEPKWYDRPFESLFKFWKERWCAPRSQRTQTWKQFNNEGYFSTVKNLLCSM